MKKHGRVDENQSEIVAALRATGHSVQILSAVGGGCPDLLVGRNGRNFLLEVKTKDGTLTGEQAVWFDSWNGWAMIVRSVEEAIAAVNLGVRARQYLTND